MTNGELIELHSALQELCKQPLPWSQGKQVRKIRDAVSDEVDRLEDARQEAMKPYAQTDEDGELVTNEANQVQFTDRAGWMRESQEFMEEEADFELDEDLAIDEQYLVNARLSPNAQDVLIKRGVVREG